MIAQDLHKVIGGDLSVVEYIDDNNKSKIDKYIGVYRPYENISTYGTIGLSDFSIDLKTAKNKSIRIELIGVCDTGVDKFANIISSCSFSIINSKYSCKPGTAYPNVV